MMESARTYVGILITVGLVVLVGILATQGLLEGQWADLATGVILGGGGGIAIGAKIQPKP